MLCQEKQSMQHEVINEMKRAARLESAEPLHSSPQSSTTTTVTMTTTTSTVEGPYEEQVEKAVLALDLYLSNLAEVPSGEDHQDPALVKVGTVWSCDTGVKTLDQRPV